jgi:integrase
MTAAVGSTFTEVAGEWLDKNRPGWSAIHYTKSKRALERDVYPKIGKLPVAQVSPAMVSRVIEDIVKRGRRETALKVLQHVTGVFRFAQSRDLRPDNPAEPAIEVLPKKGRKGRMAALLEFSALGDILRRAEAAALSPAVRMAHRLTAFTVARISNIVEADWSEFDLESDTPTWTIPRRKLKARDRDHDHKIILCPGIADELREWRRIIGSKGYCFPSPQGGDRISRESLEKVYRVTLGLRDRHSPHGWRASFATLAREEGHDREVVELALDHVHDNEIARAYDRGERLKKRIALMEWWGQELTRAQRGAEVLPLKQKA